MLALFSPRLLRTFGLLTRVKFAMFVDLSNGTYRCNSTTPRVSTHLSDSLLTTSSGKHARRCR